MRVTTTSAESSPTADPHREPSPGARVAPSGAAEPTPSVVILRLRRIAGALSLVAGLSVLASIVWQVTDQVAAGRFQPTEYFAYFTIQTALINIVVLVVGGLLAFRTPLELDGTFKRPQLHPDVGRLGLRGGIALTLATITPPAALLATLELGPGEDAACGGHYAM